MPTPPNILVFMTDDHGPWGANCLGTPALHTPALDELARTGVVFPRAFTPSPVCSPGRASFQTGRLPSAHGIHDWLSESKSAADHPGLLEQPTIAGHLGGIGYQSAHVGKWHCGHSWQPQAGYDLWAAFSQGPHFGNTTCWENGQAQTHRGYHDALVADRAMRFLDEREGEKPFFLSVGFTATHSAFANHAPRHVSANRGLGDALPDEQPDDRHAFVRRGRPPADEEAQWQAQYGAAISTIDEQVGRVLDKLDAAGARENTLVVYTSDHGHNNGHHGIWCKGNATVPQNFYEESIRVPFILSWPERVPGGRRVEVMIDHCDLFATLLHAAGADMIDICNEVDSPGNSFLLHATGETDGLFKRSQLCEYGNARMARRDRYKLIRRWPGPNGHYPDELYDLEADPREHENCIDDPALAEVAAELREDIEVHFAAWEDPAVSGLAVGEQPPCNAGEPWRLTEPDG